MKSMAMNQSSRSRFLKYGGVVAFFLLMIFYFGRGESSRVGDIIGGNIASLCVLHGNANETLIQVHLLHKLAMG